MTLVAIEMTDRMADVMRTLGHDPAKPETRALAYLAARYDLDPILYEVRLIGVRGTMEPYITRDGMLTIAHRSGVLNGIIVKEWRRNSTNDGYTCFVEVWRKDMDYPFSVGAQCKDTERQAKEGWGMEQALARSMRRTLKVAFNINSPEVDEASDRDVGVVHVAPETIDIEGPGSEPEDVPADAPGSPPSGASAGTAADAWPPAPLDQKTAHIVVGQLSDKDRAAFLTKHGIADFTKAWHEDALIDAAILAEEPF